MSDNRSGKPIIAGIGEVLWDVLEQSEELGGAPVNFAYHAGALGAEAYAISCIGDDRRGKAAIEELKKRQVSTEHITELPGATTGYVLASVDEAGVASYEFPDDVAWDRLQIADKTRTLAGKLNAVCFGSLGQRSQVSQRVIQDYVGNLPGDSLKVFDLNIRQNFYTEEIIRTSLQLADVLKLNDDEIIVLAEMFDLRGDQEARMRLLVERFALRLGVLTRGEKGSLLVSKDEVSEHGGYSSKVVDTIGAGDSFTAVTVLGLLKGYSIDDINEHANRVASYVCSCQGAMPPLPDHLLINRN
ncbi:PfkB family carbohydrate kinase [Desulfopila sp. IMCC35008]|uniref:PfkB family carbohydrate kinase n=1 Tax=Desulfopila sp. IMCC35008 TaxID=2653858 RepID=UPI0013D10B08|nr:PfkB family carbohydrate kinase [Desulfopila sp. IMCC35008]